jgi:hypothetical protein
MEKYRAEREKALTRFACAWALVLAILFWATSSSPEEWPVRFSIQWSFGPDAVSLMEDAASTRVAGEGVHGAEMVPASWTMGRVFDAPAARVSTNLIPGLRCGMKRLAAAGRESLERGASPTQFELVASLMRQGRTRVAMRMMVMSAEVRD